MIAVIEVSELERLVRTAVEDVVGERPSQPALLDRAGLAQALGVSTRSLDTLRHEGLPELRVGDAPRFDLPEVLAWLRSRRLQATQGGIQTSQPPAIA